MKPQYLLYMDEYKNALQKKEIYNISSDME